MSDSGLFTTRFTFVRGSAVVRAGSKLLRSSKRGVPGQLLQNELILEFPTKSMPSGFRAAAIVGSLDAFSVRYTSSASLPSRDLIRGLTRQSICGRPPG